MIPSLSSGVPPRLDSVVAVPPPLRFRPLQGEPRNVAMQGSYFGTKPTGSAAQRGGMRYERKAQSWLKEHVPNYLASPQFTFRDDSGARSIVPDGIATFGDEHSDELLVIFEIKITHMPDAWWQLEKLYRPVLQAWHPRAKVVCIEVTRTYDPAVPFPVEHELIYMPRMLNLASVLRRSNFWVLPCRC